jgi:hypothetical protein
VLEAAGAEARVRRRAVSAASPALAEVGQQPPGDGRRQRRLAAHDLLQFLDQHLEAVFLEQVAVGAALQRREQVVVVGIERGDDLGGRVLRQLGQQFHAVAVGQFQIDQDQLERVGAVQAAGPPASAICRALSRSPASVMAIASLKLSRTTRHRKLRATGLSSRIRTLTAMRAPLSALSRMDVSALRLAEVSPDPTVSR